MWSELFQLSGVDELNIIKGEGSARQALSCSQDNKGSVTMVISAGTP